MDRKSRMMLRLLAAALCLLLPLSMAAADAPEASLSNTNLENGVYTGAVTLNAPDGYEIADANGANWGASLTITQLNNGANTIAYVLRPAGGGESVQRTVTVQYAAPSSGPSVTLFGPTTGAAVGSGQKLVLLLGGSMQPVSGKKITITSGNGSWSADASACSLQGGFSIGALYAVCDFSAFSGLTLSTSTSYSVAIEAGAFQTAGGTASAALAASFSTASDSALLPVVYTLGSGSSWSVKTSDGASVPCGAGVTRGTTLVFAAPSPSGYTGSFTVKSGGAAVASPSLDRFEVTAYTEAYAKLDPFTSAALTGDVTVSGTPAVGSVLTASLKNSNETDASRLTYTWKRGETKLATGASYTPVVADLGYALTVSVVSSAYTSDRSAGTAVVTKAVYPGGAPAAPTRASATETSVTLGASAGYEYRMNGGAWQSSPTFTGLAANTNCAFTQRVAETGATLASAESAQLSCKTKGPLTGAASVNGTLQVGYTLTAALNNTNNSGTLSYVWKRGASIVAYTQAYTPTAQDAGQQLTIEITSDFESGTLSFTTAAVRKAAYSGSSPAAPTLQAASSTSVALLPVSGYEYSCGGTVWQSSSTFIGLTPGKTYYFYQRTAATANAEASVASPALAVNTTSAGTALTGSLSVSGTMKYGQTLVATLTNSNNTGTLSYIWKVNGAVAGNSSAYEVKASDLYCQITVEVSSSVETGTLTSAVGTVQKSDYLGELPPAPTRKSRTSTSITLNTVSGCEYSRDGSTWQSSTTFSGLSAGKTYSFYQRYKATSTSEASPRSEALKTSTTASSSDSAPTPMPTSKTTPKPTTAVTASPTVTSGQSSGAYTYTVPADSTRILYSTMQNLVAVNKAQDVIIQLNNASYTFAKGSMQLGAEQAWYDFGVEINNCIHEEAGQRLSGNGYVATVHFNYSGALPAEAVIRLLVGTNYAGKTLRYEKLDTTASSLTYLCDATVDTAGWASVTQSSCSDYVLSDQNAAPSPTPDASPSPSANPLDNEPEVPNEQSGIGVTGWIITLMIVAALALVAVGVYLYYKNRDY